MANPPTTTTDTTTNPSAVLPLPFHFDPRNYEVLSDFDDHLRCTICFCPFIDPIQLPCDHIFCRDCINQLIRSSRTSASLSSPTFTDVGDLVEVSLRDFSCPKCRRTVRNTARDIVPAPRVIVNMCEEITVRCPFSDLGCPETMERNLARMHAERYCEFRPVKCPAARCGRGVPKKKAELQGAWDGRCLHEEVLCEGCGEVVMQMDMPDHQRDLCDAILTSCTDCGISLTRRDLLAHIDTCPHRTSACPGTSIGCTATRLTPAERSAHESACVFARLAPYLETQQSNMRSMEKNIKALRQRNEVLEEMLEAKADRAEYEYDEDEEELGRRTADLICDVASGHAAPPGPVPAPASGRGRGRGNVHAHGQPGGGGSIFPSRHRPRQRTSVNGLTRSPAYFDTAHSAAAPSSFPATASATASASTSSTTDVHTLHTSADRYLLSLHEALREEVLALANTLNELDSRTSANLAMMNDIFRMREEVTHLNMYVNTLRVQVGRLRAPAVVAASATNGAASPAASARTSAYTHGSSAGASSSDAASTLQTQRVRDRTSSTSRASMQQQQPQTQQGQRQRQGSVSRPSSSHGNGGGGGGASSSTSTSVSGHGMLSATGVPIESRGRRVSETGREGTKL